MKKVSKCIYCLKEKPRTDFNREHVISRMLGTYENNPVLRSFEVCKECNSYFCDKLESVISLDSYEGLLRTQYTQKTHSSNVRPIGKTRLFVTGQNDIFKGLRFFVSTNSCNPETILLEAVPSVGIINDLRKNEYIYYQLDKIPQCTEPIRVKMSKAESPIITFGYTEEEVFTALSKKGYSLSNVRYHGGLKISDVTSESSIIIEIKSIVDTLLSRLAAKSILNYLCFTYGKEYVLETTFDDLRSFVRYGKKTESIKMCINNGGVSGLPGRVENGHIIGTALAVADNLYLCGFVSWFGAITYSFLIEKQSDLTAFPDISFSICDNKTRLITEYHNPLIVEWPNSKHSVSIIKNNVVLTPKGNITNEVKSDV